MLYREHEWDETERRTLYTRDRPDRALNLDPGQVHTTSGLLSLSGFAGLLQVPAPAWKTVRASGFCRKLLSQPNIPLTEPYRPIQITYTVNSDHMTPRVK